MAIKLIAPVQFENRLSGLQILQPLNLNSEVKIGLDNPVFDSNPADSNRPVSGKFARCSEQGGLLTTHNSYHNVVDPDVNPYWYFAIEVITVTFPVEVYKVQALAYWEEFEAVMNWCTSTGITLTSYTTAGSYVIPFRGRVMYFDRDEFLGASGIILKGFY